MEHWVTLFGCLLLFSMTFVSFIRLDSSKLLFFFSLLSSDPLYAYNTIYLFTTFKCLAILNKAVVNVRVQAFV